MINKIVAILALCAVAKAGQVDSNFVSAVGKIESSNNPNAVGDSGRARGEFQFWKPAWDQINAARKARGQPQYDWAVYAHDKAIAGQYAYEYLSWIESSLCRRLKRQPSKAEIYAGFNLGLGSFAKRGYDLSKVPASTKNAISKL